MPQVNAQFYTDHETMASLAYYGKMFKSLYKYRKQLVQEAAEKGYPVVRSMLFEFYDDVQAWNLTEQFMFGGSILVKPVLDPSKNSINVYLPFINESWVHVWSGESYSNGWFTLNAPIGQSGIFIRESHLQKEELQAFIQFARNA
jgi:alpha-glucosidase